MIAREAKLKAAQQLMENFSSRTGLAAGKGKVGQRYLWTDAFAVNTFFGLAHACEDISYKDKALKLIDMVHENLGRFHPDDSRKGWISGLSEEEGRNHPTAGGLRIGKKLPERQENEPFNERLEWDRDGQYFHYLTRWANALLMATQETGSAQYAVWAAELLQASESFVDKDNDRIRMFWKMSVDLSRPLISNMGAHDPLEGLICAESVIKAAPAKEKELASFVKDMEKLCAGKDWFTTDDLGIGGLLLNAIRVSELAKEKGLPEEIRPEKLMANSLEGMKMYARKFDKNRPASQRLPFRECGLSLGLRALLGLNDLSKAAVIFFNQLLSYLPLADDIEDFWRSRQNRQSSTWSDHLDINEVSLASSMTAKYYPYAYTLSGNEQ
jgi:hypothetical protein